MTTRTIWNWFVHNHDVPIVSLFQECQTMKMDNDPVYPIVYAIVFVHVNPMFIPCLSIFIKVLRHV